jgi:hypothetical protein
MSQTSYSIDQGAAKAGGVYDLGFNDFISLAAQATIPFGCFVCKGTAEDQVKVPAATGDVTDITKARGFAAATQAHEQVSGASVDQYVQYDTVSVMQRGRMWVTCEANWTQASSVFVRFATGTGTQLGAVLVSADTATAVALPGAKFLNSGSAGGLALIQFDLLG